jgi:hypothetical protein
VKCEKEFQGMLDLVIEEYEIATDGSSKYFGYMYQTINVFAITVMAIVAIAFSKEVTPMLNKFLFQFCIPLIGYIFGLFYAYNSYAIAKIGTFQKICEEKIKILSKEITRSNAYLGWTYYVAKKPDSFILPYGTLLAFFLLMPPFSIIYLANVELDTFKFALDCEPIKKTYFIISIACYFVYLFFMIKIMVDSKKMIDKRGSVYITHYFDNEGKIYFEEKHFTNQTKKNRIKDVVTKLIHKISEKMKKPKGSSKNEKI